MGMYGMQKGAKEYEKETSNATRHRIIRKRKNKILDTKATNQCPYCLKTYIETETLYMHLILKQEREHARNPAECPLQPTYLTQKQVWEHLQQNNTHDRTLQEKENPTKPYPEKIEYANNNKKPRIEKQNIQIQHGKIIWERTKRTKQTEHGTWECQQQNCREKFQTIQTVQTHLYKTHKTEMPPNPMEEQQCTYCNKKQKIYKNYLNTYI